MGLGMRRSQPILEGKTGRDGIVGPVDVVWGAARGSCCSWSATAAAGGSAPPGKGQAGSTSPASSWACTRMKGACVQGADGGRLGNEGVWRFSPHQGPGRWQDWSASARGMALRGAVPEHGQHRAAPSSTHHKPSRARSTPVLPFSAPCFVATLYSWL